jgi:hypothetical protein
MRCPTCVSEGERSTVTVGGGSVTLMHSSPFFDEDGAYHSHDPNIHTQSYACSRGHRWTEQTKAKCPADGCTWGSGA